MARSEAVELVATVTAEVASAVADFDHFGDAVKDAANEADAASDKVRNAADATDNLDSKSAAATGSLGALSSGFELVGADQYAGALQGAALATDFMSGVGQGLTLILELQSVQWVVNRAKMVANTVASWVQVAATQAVAAAQWLLNAALNANPIGLVILAVVALVAAMVLLYRRSSTVRAILNAVWSALKTGAAATLRAVKAAFDGIYNAAASVVTWMKNRFVLIIGYITGPIKTAKDTVVGYWDAIWDGVKDFPADFGDLFDDVADAITGALKDVGSGALSSLIGWANDIIGVVNKLIRAFNKLPGPDIDQVPTIPTSSAASRSLVASMAAPAIVGRFGATALAAPGASQSIVINVTGAVDPEATARQIRRLLGASDIRHGTIQRTLRTA